MSSRIIRSNGGSLQLIDCFSSLLLMEVINPSKEIYIISPWITNSTIINNEYNRFSDVFPFVESKHIKFTDIIETCAWKGSNIKIICDMENKWTKGFINNIDNSQKMIEFRQLEDNHEKGFITDNFYIHGSMNFTYSGIYINGESIRITTNKSEVSNALISVKTRWKDAELI